MKRVASSMIYGGSLAAFFIMSSAAFGGPTQWFDSIQSTSPTVWYRFNETSGTSAADSGSAGETGTYEGGVTLNQTGVVGRAVLFDGVNDVVHATTVPVGASFSVEVLAKSALTNWNTYDGFGGSRDNNGFLFGGSLNSTFVEAYVGNNVTINNGMGAYNASPIDTDFKHYVLTYNVADGKAFMYMNGVQTKTNTYSFGINERIAAILSNLYVGADVPTGRYTNLLIDDFVLYNTALDPSQVTAHFNAFSTVPEPSSLALFSLAIAGCGRFARRFRRS